MKRKTRIKRVADRQLSPVRYMDASVEHRHLAAECRSLARYLKSDNELKQQMDAAETRVKDDYLPSLATLNLLHSRFFSMPEHDRIYQCGGWNPRDDRPTHDFLLERCSHMPAMRVLEVWPGTSGPSTAAVEWELSNTYTPLRDCIAFGATREQVLAEIAVLKDLIEQRWRHLLTDPMGAIHEFKGAHS